MAMRNSARGWGGIARLLHWGMAVLLAIEVPAGFVMTRTYAATDPRLAAWHHIGANVHHTLGLILLLLAGGRGLWRLFGEAPAAIGTRLERRAARSAHGLLYALLLLVPLSGWAAVSSLRPSAQFPNPLWVFGRDGFGPGGWMPHLVPPVAWDAATVWRYSTFGATHRWLLNAGAGLLLLHVAAALRHHFLLRDDTLRRMIRDTP